MKSLFTGDTYKVSVLGYEKGTVKARDAKSAIIRGSQIWNGGNTSGVSVIKIEDEKN